MNLNSKLIIEYDVDEIVYDKLTRKHVKLIGIEYKIGKLGFDANTTTIETVNYYVENSVDNGCRQPWQIDKIDVYALEDVDNEYLNFFFRK